MMSYAKQIRVRYKKSQNALLQKIMMSVKLSCERIEEFESALRA